MIDPEGGMPVERRGITQEGLKFIACLSMLLDHLGVIIVAEVYYRNPTAELLAFYNGLRLVGRLAFPIYCFLLAEGSVYTRNPLRYGLRLAIAALISEIPYDLAFRGGINWQYQNVMVTLFLAFCALEIMKKCPNLVLKLLAAMPFTAAAELAAADYGANGVLLAVLFALTRDMPHGPLLQFAGMWFLFSPGHAMMLNWTGGIHFTVQEWAVLALIPIHFYRGRKVTTGKAVQWAYYLFYPVHLLVLTVIGR